MPTAPRRGLPPVLLPLAALLLLVFTVHRVGFRNEAAEAQALPPACLDPNPFFATTCFVRGETFDHEPSVVAFRDTPDDSDHHLLASIGQTGAVYGLAYHPASDVLYASAYHKRAARFGDLGPGGIYAVQVNGGGVTPFVTVPNAGRDTHDRSNNYQPDASGRTGAGTTSLGDIDLNEDGTDLFVMNMHDRRIYRYSLSDGNLVGSFPTGAARETWARDARPFALKIQEGWVYHGLVDSAVRRQSPQNLWAYVYASRFDGSGMREVARVWLGYDREPHPAWNPWPEDDDLGWRRASYPHPMLTDIEFDDAGNMILGLRDRYIDTGPSLTEVYRRAPGDILLVPKTGTMTWALDFRAPEHYTGDDLASAGYSELAAGGLARVMARDVVVSTAINVFRTFSDGAIWFDNVTGGDVGREELLYNARRHEGPQGKGQGLGDLELVCYTPPTPTPTATPRPSRTPPPPTVTPTPGRTDYTIYLPSGERADTDKCIPDAYHADVVLVLDRSTSMLRSVEEGGIQKNAAAIAAARAFIARLDFTPDANGRHDQVAIVGFNDLAWIEHDLTNDADSALAALDVLAGKTQEGTRLDLAFVKGQAPLDGPRRKPENLPVIILLTDGLPNRVPTPAPVGPQEATVLEASLAARAKGTRVYTIGLGLPTDINARLLIISASEAWRYYYAPRPEDLDGIYAQIALSLDDCAPDPFPTPTRCIPEESHTDVVLILDMSTSMYRPTRDGRTKHQAAQDAARLFASLMDFEVDGYGRHDQMAVVGFNDVAWTEIELSNEPTLIDAAIARLTTRVQEGTRLDLALREAQNLLESQRHYLENQPVLVLLTDGIPNRVPTPAPVGGQEDTVLAEATRAKAAGTVVFTIGLGQPEDIVEWMLVAAASDPSRYYYAPDGADLEGIYRQIAGRVRDCIPDGVFARPDARR